jgi:predicted RNA-binding protein with RPS1 domain
VFTRISRRNGTQSFVAGATKDCTTVEADTQGEGQSRERKKRLIKSPPLPIAVSEVHSTLHRTNQTGWLRGTMRRRPARPAPYRNTTMKIINSSLGLGLLLSLAAGSAPAVRAEDKPVAPAKPAAPANPTPPVRAAASTATTPAGAAARKPVTQQLSGKVVAVDKYGKTVTLQVNNLTYVLQIADATRISKAGKDRNLNEVVVGQEVSVTVMLRELSDGRVEVSVLSMDLDESEEAQGRRGRGQNRGRGKGHHHHGPFHHGPHPPNVDGPIVSPHR